MQPRTRRGKNARPPTVSGNSRGARTRGCGDVLQTRLEYTITQRFGSRCRVAWIKAVSASLLLFTDARAEPGPARALAALAARPLLQSQSRRRPLAPAPRTVMA